MPQNSLATQTEIRLDIWLWRARFYKSRSLCARLIKRGKIRIHRNGKTARTLKPHFAVHAGDQLVFMRDDVLVHIEILDIGTRRGPAREAHTLYHSLSEDLNERLDTATKYPLSA